MTPEELKQLKNREFRYETALLSIAKRVYTHEVRGWDGRTWHETMCCQMRQASPPLDWWYAEHATGCAIGVAARAFTADWSPTIREGRDE